MVTHRKVTRPPDGWSCCSSCGWHCRKLFVIFFGWLSWEELISQHPRGPWGATASVFGVSKRQPGPKLWLWSDSNAFLPGLGLGLWASHLLLTLYISLLVGGLNLKLRGPALCRVCWEAGGCWEQWKCHCWRFGVCVGLVMQGSDHVCEAQATSQLLPRQAKIVAVKRQEMGHSQLEEQADFVKLYHFFPYFVKII